MKMKKIFYNLLFLSFAIFLTGCAAVRKQVTVPSNLIYQAQIPIAPKARVVIDQQYFPQIADYFAPTLNILHNKLASGKDTNILSVSGGSSNGAFGAGLMCGWTKAGNRPKFDIVTGVSTGAFIGLFAFLGPKYDSDLQAVYTSTSSKNIYTFHKLRTLFFFRHEAITNTHPLHEMLNYFITMDLLHKVAAQYQNQRRFYVATAQLDAKRFVIWDMGKIASIGTPEALDLFRNIMLASSAIPVAFPPVHFNVVANGKYYDELHVDGGTGSQVFGNFYTKNVTKNTIGKAHLYVIRNGKLAGDPQKVQDNTISIAQNALLMMTINQADGDTIRIYLQAKMANVDYNLAAIPQNFTQIKHNEFDQIYMQNLFKVGYNAALNGYRWQKTPTIYEGIGW